jgi:hypothetical protein
VTDDDDPELEPVEASDDEPAIDTATAQPKRFRAATDKELDPQSFIVGDDRSALRTVLHGGSILKDRGDAWFIGRAMQHLTRSLRETAEQYRRPTEVINNALLRTLAWTSSVVIELEISAVERVEQTLDGTRRSPTIDAARALGNLLGADADDLLPRALQLGPKPTAEYKQFLHLLAGDDVTLEWQVPDSDQIVVVTSADANRDFAILSREGQPATEQIRVPGTLTMADSRRHRFELSLPAKTPATRFLARKKTVWGEYAEEVGHRPKEEGLWDTEVMATIDVTYELPDTTPTPRESTFILVSAEPLISNSPQLFE